MSPATYPVRVTARLDADVSRGLWLVKWILAIPHYLVLVILWLAFAVLSIGAFFAILITGRYPRSIFDFNVGVMRWTWRVTFYAYGALGTDRYPPFSLADDPGYPAHLEVSYPEHLSRGLVLVKWWLLALPHYLVVAFFVGGGLYATDAISSNGEPLLFAGGLVGLLVLIAAVVLLVSGRYPKSIFDLVIGLQRWTIRVAAYAALMTDDYPPFRLDQGGAEPFDGDPVPESFDPPAPAPLAEPANSSIGAGPVTAIVAGAVSLLVACGLLTATVAVVVANHALPDEDGFFMSSSLPYETSTYAITSEAIDLNTADAGGASLPDVLFGDAKVTAEASEDGSPVFVGVGPTEEVETYLRGVARSTLVTVEIVNGQNQSTYRDTPGQAPSTPPAQQDIWTDSSTGARPTISFPLRSSSWTVVVMHADGSADVSAEVSAGATFPAMGWLVTILLFGTGFFLLVGLIMIIGGLKVARHRRLGHDPGTPASTTQEMASASR
jgi:hypothetical protein